MKIKHLLENTEPVDYISQIAITIDPGQFMYDQIYQALYDASIDTDFELVDRHSDTLIHFASVSNNLRVVMKRTMQMMNAIRSVEEIQQSQISFSLTTMKNYISTVVTDKIGHVEEFLRMKYTTEEQLLSIVNNRI